MVRRLFSQDGRIEFANLQIGFQLAYYRVRLFRLKAGGKGINVDTARKTGGLLQRPVSHCLRCCSLPSNLSLLYLSTPGNLSPFHILLRSTVTLRHSWTSLLPIPRRNSPSSPGINSIRCDEFHRFFFFFFLYNRITRPVSFPSSLLLSHPTRSHPLGREIFEMEES